jgi:hypothetical protein
MLEPDSTSGVVWFDSFCRGSLLLRVLIDCGGSGARQLNGDLAIVITFQK